MHADNENDMGNALQEKQAELEQREAALAEKEAALAAKSKSPKFNLYERVNVSVKQLDKIILVLLGVMALVLIAAVCFGGA